MKTEILNKSFETKKGLKTVIKNWAPNDGPHIYDQVEKLNWAPWLAATPETLSGRAEVFPEGQLIIKDESSKKILATLSTNRINWSGNLDDLPCWDDVAGEPTDYSNTFMPAGNTLVLMSMNVHPDFQKEGLARQLIEEIKKQAKNLGITHLIGSFRPNEYGKFKSQGENWKVDFEEYCKMTRDDGWPIDGWLRSLMKNGMEPQIVDQKAMTVQISTTEFLNYKSMKPEKWKEVTPGIWECQEVGFWKVDGNQAIYQECNLWGKL